MKIGILTYHRARNYGAFIQAYALATGLKHCFPDEDIEIIDYEAPRDIFYRVSMYVRNVLRLRFKNAYSLWRMDRMFESGYRKLPMGHRIVERNPNKSIDIISKEYDLVVIGSDAVFNWTLNPIPNVYFFNSNKCRHVTYAASAHLNRYKESNENQKRYVEEALAKCSYIGTRDRETERFVKYFNPQCVSHHNCDPTVILDMNFEVPELGSKLEKYGIKKGDKIICLMLKHPEYGKVIREKYGKEYKIVAIRKNNEFADVFLDDLDPFEWAKFFGYAQLTITDFFHGTLLSLRNSTPVISIDSSSYCGEYESKARDLMLTRLNLPVMFFDPTKKSIDEFGKQCDAVLNEDWCGRIENAIEKEAESFKDFCEVLRNMLFEVK